VQSRYRLPVAANKADAPGQEWKFPMKDCSTSGLTAAA
jgi:hypothetical protein